MRLFYGRRPASDLKFLVDIMQMGLHGARGNMKLSGDLIPLKALRGQGEDFKLPCRKESRALRGASGSPYTARRLEEYHLGTNVDHVSYVQYLPKNLLFDKRFKRLRSSKIYSPARNCSKTIL